MNAQISAATLGMGIDSTLSQLGGLFVVIPVIKILLDAACIQGAAIFLQEVLTQLLKRVHVAGGVAGLLKEGGQ